MRPIERKCYGNDADDREVLRRGIKITMIKKDGFFMPKECEYLKSIENRRADMCCAGGRERKELGYCKYFRNC